MDYLARSKDGTTYFCLTKDAQFDSFLKKGFDIYQTENLDEEGTLIATSEDGFLIDRPSMEDTDVLSLSEFMASFTGNE